MWRVAVFVLALTGCYYGREANPGAPPGASETSAASGGVNSDDDGGDESGGEGEDDNCRPADAAAAAAPLRRLTRREYRNAVVDLIGPGAADLAELPPDERPGTFVSNSVSPVDDWVVERYRDLAEDLASVAVADVVALTGCTEEDPACASAFVGSFGRRALRRPLTVDEHARYLAVYDTVRGTADHEAGVAAVVETFLQSPHFLYHVEIGPQLDAYAVASRLSFLVWRSIPDEPLLDAAEAGELDDGAGLRAEAERLLDSPRSRDAVEDFVWQWLAISDLPAAFKDPDMFPEYGEALVEDMLAEPVDLVEHVLRDGDRKLATLFGADYTLASDALLAIYGSAAGATDDAGVTRFAGAQRAGLLTQPGVMAATSHVDQTSPVFRGLFLRENVLCEGLPPPPPDVNNTPPPLRDDATTRERFEQDHAVPGCWACHQLIDTLGFAFEHYDPIGRWRDDEHGRPIDASGEFVGLGSLEGEFADARELAQHLASSPEAEQCFAQRWYEYGLGRPARESDDCAVEALQAKFAAAGGDIRELIVALVTSDAFRNVRGEEPGS